jgi:hypothetical protein
LHENKKGNRVEPAGTYSRSEPLMEARKRHVLNAIVNNQQNPDSHL